MAEETSFGVARLRQAITNQATCGSGQFELSIDSADKLCREIENELESLSWAEGIPAPVDADGNVVPLTTKVMYTNRGQKIELREFCLLHSVLSGGFVWRAIRHVGNSVEDLKLDSLHLRRPDSWEGLEADIESLSHKESVCRYFGHGNDISCDVCPAEDIDKYCSAAVARDILHRAKALVERDMKEASRG